MNFRSTMMILLLLFVSVLICSQDLLSLCMTSVISGELLSTIGFLVIHAVLLYACYKLLIYIVEKYHHPMMGFLLELYIKMYIVFAIICILTGEIAQVQDFLCNIAVVLALRGLAKI